MIQPNPTEMSEMFAFSVHDAVQCGGIIDIKSWLQIWPNTACGHKRWAGQAMTKGLVVAIRTRNDSGVDSIRFYSNGQLIVGADVNSKVERMFREQTAPSWNTDILGE
jgi:hypothetical protein